jgi:hypothetical protein
LDFSRKKRQANVACRKVLVGSHRMNLLAQILFSAVVVSVSVCVAIAVVAVYRSNTRCICVSIVISQHSRVRRDSAAIGIRSNISIGVDYTLPLGVGRGRVGVVSVIRVGGGVRIISAAASRQCRCHHKNQGKSQVASHSFPSSSLKL